MTETYYSPFSCLAHFAGWTNKKERLLIVSQACSNCIRNAFLVKDYKYIKDYKNCVL